MRILSILLTVVILSTAAVSDLLPICCTPQRPGYQIDLIAGQHYDVGDMHVSIEEYGGELCLAVTYSLRDDFNIFLTETHLEVVCDDPSYIPQTETGNPIPGAFTYQTEHEVGMVSEYTYYVPLAQFMECEEQVLYVAAHAVVVLLDEYGEIVRDETGWGGCIGDCCFEFQGDEVGSWGFYFAFGKVQ
jgi:hypothetical protein